MNQAQLTSRIVKPVVFVLALVPCAYLGWGVFNGGLGANPVETITHETGDWALRLLLLTLAITPIRSLTRWHSAIRLRRMLGLFSFFYVMVHFTTYLWLDHYFDLAAIAEDIIERPYVTAGFTALLVMLPLALTSTNAMIKRLGGQNWRRLHRLVYVAAAAALLHFVWLVKADLREPLIYVAVAVVLIAFRLPAFKAWLSKRKTRRDTTDRDVGATVDPARTA